MVYLRSVTRHKGAKMKFNWTPLKYKAPALLAVALLQTACSRGVIDSSLIAEDSVTGSNNIYRSYSLAHDESSRTTMFNAVFTVKDVWGTYVRLAPPSQLRVNNNGVRDDSVIDRPDGGELAAFYAGFIFPLFWIYMGDQSRASYSAVVPNKTSEVLVDWTDPQGRLIQDRLALPAFQVKVPTQVKMGEDLIVAVEGEGFDRFGVQLTPASSQQSTKIFSETFSLSREIRIPSSVLNEMPRGKATISIEANAEQTLNAQTSAGGKATMLYKKRPFQVQLVY